MAYVAITSLHFGYAARSVRCSRLRPWLDPAFKEVIVGKDQRARY